MKALIVRLFTTEGDMDEIHGGGVKMPYLFLLDKNLCFAYRDGALTVFESTLDMIVAKLDPENRHKEAETVGEVDVPDIVAQKLKEFVRCRENIEHLARVTWTELAKKHKKLREPDY